MERLFSSWNVGGFKARNRSVRSATSMRMAGAEGEVTDELLSVHMALGSGMVGIDITGHAFVSPSGRAREGQLGAWSDHLIPGLSRLASVISGSGAVPILQISHAGMLSVPLSGERVSPSPRKGARELSVGEIEEIIEDFVRASLRAYKAGFAGVQIHAAHGYLLSQFLSPKLNKRDDEFCPPDGGIKIIRAIMSGIRSEVGQQFIISIKMGPDGGDGFSVGDMVKLVREVEGLGLSFVEISRGACSYEEIVRKDVSPGKNEAYNLGFAMSFMEEVGDSIPVVLVGGIRSPSTVKDVLGKGISAVSFSRPLIREPELIKRWMDGDLSPSSCVSCNRCATEKGPARCYSKR